ncbi:hypothetical protein CRH09_27645 [Nocardia terpenica]|uniref:Uncharacterized protein n=1 Tax=Nocardia terpenica TaxID=455432 RepID=A0A291RPY0_9NOCA|nr:hypothetical protein CRH09_27645 [Nocardia terpenica]
MLVNRGPADRQKPTAGTALALPPLTELRQRRSAKWRTFAADVPPLPVAEMDFPLAAAAGGVSGLDRLPRHRLG